jgi:hypothetical protein
MSYQHGQLAAGRWAKMPLVEQMANIGSEIERALGWRSKGSDAHARKAFERALELIDLTLGSSKRSAVLKELARLREAVIDYFAGDNEYKSSDSSWRRYFLHFVYACRKNT